MSNLAHFAYVAGGYVWHRSTFDTKMTDPQMFAEALARLPLDEPTDEFRVWFGDPDGTPHGVAWRPLSTAPAPRGPVPIA
jgi:hypothetical protein